MKDIKTYLIQESSNILHDEWDELQSGEFRTNDGSILMYFTEALTMPFVKDPQNCLEISLLNVVKKRTGVGSSLVNEIIKYANKINKDIVVYAIPAGPFISVDELIEFYKKLGFKNEKCNDLDSSLNPNQVLRYTNK